VTSTRPVRLRPAHVPFAALAVASMLLVGGCSKSNDSPSPTSSASGGLLDKALKESTTGDTAGAKRDFKALATQNPGEKLAPYNLGVIAQRAGDDATAVAEYNKALAIDPNYEPALYNLAILIAKKGDNSSAVALYQRAIKANPKDANAHYNLGLLYQSMGDLQKAVAEVNAAIKLNPSLKPISTSSPAAK
jgi:tetratricopeptide (TPR) repeat protein